VPKDQIEQWIDEPFETPHYPSEADMHNCACVEWNGQTGEDLLYTLKGPLFLSLLDASIQVQAPDLNAARLTLTKYAEDAFADAQVFINIEEADHASGIPDNPSAGSIRIYCDGEELWIIRSGGSKTQIS
jgi:hypothetical protein